MKPRKLLGIDGIIERCPGCWDALKAGAWLKDGEHGKPRVLMILSYCKKCKKHLRTTYLFYEQQSYNMSTRGVEENEAWSLEADPLQTAPEPVTA